MSGDGACHRRAILRAAGLAVTGPLLLAGCTTDQQREPAGSGPGPPLPATEDLMREHGLLNRILVIYDEVGRRLGADQPVPAGPLHQAAQIVLRFVHEHHEHLEEQYVFAPLQGTDREITRLTEVLATQHSRGELITVSVASRTSGALSAADRQALAGELAAFARMYLPHESREDTVVFPRLRDALGAAAFAALSEQFAQLEDERFGAHGFAEVVDQVADIEKTLGIADLAQFTA
ncbi:MAG: hypothetical protein L0H84_19625 [Pseudonocardia sp.]|nr:hypothetical protein [Pseudonocardia sp.]